MGHRHSNISTFQRLRHSFPPNPLPRRQSHRPLSVRHGPHSRKSSSKLARARSAVGRDGFLRGLQSHVGRVAVTRKLG